MRIPSCRACGMLFLACLAPHAGSAATKITVSAGDADRRQTVVGFKLPPGSPKAAALVSDEGQAIPLQVDARGNACFVLDRLARGATRTFTLDASQATGATAAVRANREGSVVKVTAGGRPVLQYQMEPSEVPSPEIPAHFRHGAHLHPAFSPSGAGVTGDYPADHRWHRGIWLAWTSTEFEGRKPDFWNMGKEKTGQLTGEIRFTRLDRTWSGPVHGGFRARHQFIDHTGGAPKPVLNETWVVTVYPMSTGAQPYAMFDLVSTQECAGDTPLRLPKFHYGGLGYRGHPDWEQPGNFFVLTSEGETDRVKSNLQLMRWIHCGGKTGGELTGLAILCHPSNFRAPQPVRVNPKNPQICFAPSELGDWEIAPGKRFVSRYRFVVADGAPDARLLDRLWHDYAHPPAVAVVE